MQDNTSDVFRLVKTMDFSTALLLVKDQKRITRISWPWRCFIVLMPPLHLPPHDTQQPGAKVNDRTAKWIGKDKPLNCRPYLAMLTKEGDWQPGWTPSQEDLLAQDWVLYPAAESEISDKASSHG